MWKAYKTFWKNYAEFKGRSSRSDYWWVFLINSIINVIFIAFLIMPIFNLGVVAGAAGMDFNDYMQSESGRQLAIQIIGGALLPLGLWLVYLLATLLPNLAITARRLRDAGFAWWIFLILQSLVVVLNFVYPPLYYLLTIVIIVLAIFKTKEVIEPEDTF